ncbi:MAG: rhodanese-like domain-containing protein [Desulfobulbaceae bacterium]
MSPISAGLAKKAGYANVKVFLAGEPAWVKAGNPTYASPSFVSKGNIVLIDLRSTEKASVARIPRSVSIPFKSLANRIDDIPKKAPIVLYSDDEAEAVKGLKALREEGFKNVSLVPGSLDSWLQAPGKTESGPVVTEIRWQRKLGEGEVAAAEFAKAASGSAPGVVILDVRTKDEAAAGKYPAAINIPLDEIAKRSGELPKDKKIYIHCSTGARAEMAYKELKNSGFNASYLFGNVECEGAACEITD